MTQFKEKANKHPENVNAGLFTYPVLMAADILLYGTQLVPVGEDQKQHLELTRDLANGFNRKYGNVFVVPEPYIAPLGARIMSLQDPSRKMDKSDPNPANYIGLLDEPDVVRRKIRRAVTDPGSEVVFDESKPGISNLLSIHACLSGSRMQELQERYRGCGYGHLKNDLADIIIEKLRPIQDRYHSIIGDSTTLRLTLKNGAERAHQRAQKKLQEVYGLMGLEPGN
jgi:tryptophanyl-tRNA synthetase